MQSNGRLNDSANDSRLNNSRLNNSRANASHLHKTKKPFTQPQQLAVKIHLVTGKHLCSSEQQSSSERMCRGGRGLSCSATFVYIYIYSPLKKLPTQGPLLPHQYQSQDCTYRNPSNLVYHKMSVYDFSFMIPFILYSLKELRLGLNCLMKLLPYGTQSITRNLGMYTYILNFLLCISNANSILT